MLAIVDRISDGPARNEEENRMKRAVLALPAALLSSLALSALAHEGGPLVAGTPNIAPSWLGQVIAADYGGVTDDLLTGGLGKTGLGGAAPAVTDPTDPKQLRRLAIYSNYRALVDMSPLGGYGSLCGPNVKPDGTITLDAIYAHLTSGAPLPPSQVVRTTPRGGSSPAPALTPANVPAWSASPPAADRITFDGSTLTIPD
jgi:hypothetical protein